MKRKLLGLLATLLLILVICQTSFAAKVYKVSVDIHFIGNLIFSKYDVDLYLNDLMLETLPHGKDYSGSFYVEEGLSTLHFYEHGSKSVHGSINLDIQSNSSVKCTISCSNDKINVSDIKITSDNYIPEKPTSPPESHDSGAMDTVRGAKTHDSVSFSDIDLSSMSDDELANALEAIKAEQRTRVKTKIVLDQDNLVLFIGSSKRISAKITDLPKDEKTPLLTWTSSDKSVVTCYQGAIKALKAGTATVSCSATLSNGAYIFAECVVQAIIPVSSISVSTTTINLSGGETFTPSFTIRPENASIKILKFESSKPDVAKVSENGVIEGIGTGSATITASAIDGSGKSVTIGVSVIDHRISKDTAKKVLLVGICNDRAEDIFTSDGKYFDKRKFHNYIDACSMLYVIDEGIWTTSDGGNTWHVSDFLVKLKNYNTYHLYSFDIIFDGKTYILQNGNWVGAAQRRYLDKSDPWKYSEENLSDLDYYTYFFITPKQIGE